MKKLFAVLSVAAILTACNNSETAAPAADSTKTDSVAAPAAAPAVDSTKKDSTATPAADTTKPAEAPKH